MIGGKKSLKYLAIANEVERRILNGEYGVSGGKFPSIREFKSKENVSSSTAIKIYGVLKENGLISLKGKNYYLTYALIRRGTKLYKNTDKRLIGMLYPDIDNKFYILMSKAVKAAAKEKGYEVISYYCDANDPADAIVGMNVLSEVTRGVLFMCSHKDYGDYFRRYRIPLVAIGASGEDGYFDGVQVDGFGAGRIVAQKLMSEKCYKFLMVSPEMNDEENTRKSGFKYELERMNEQIGDENFISFSTDAELKVKFLKKADEFIKEGRLGVFCYHDLVLKSILDICQAHGRNILEKSYVIGFDNLPIFDNAGVYSSVAYSFKDMAKKSVGLLISRINGDYDNLTTHFIPFHLTSKI